MFERGLAEVGSIVAFMMGVIGTLFAAAADTGAAGIALGFGTAAIGLFTLMWNTYRREIKRLSTKCARSERVNDLLLAVMYTNEIPVPEEVRMLQGMTNGASR